MENNIKQTQVIEEEMTTQPLTTGSRWMIGITGALGVLAGIWALMNPIISVLSMTWIFGILMIVAGITGLVSWFKTRSQHSTSISIFMSSIVSLLLGGILAFTHVYSLAILSLAFAIWFIVDSCSWFALAKESNMPVLTRVLSIIGILVGIGLLFAPVLSLAALLYVVSFSLMIYGVMAIIKAVKKQA
ncbi:HdeD family acid-resistance protein [Lactiplantibacillus plantarum]|uniref:HdeD family acid-resistance protein n=1 Tax=Lactiplantibacillus plantarum TaxID=1590 RepID=UPI001BA873B9|nr:DUF308 domain-containing protein [Lactiplantibacillus plantarum]MBS0956472.1 DUF308 domain-containing protein [Lactiplantibacillus plantarum]